MLEFTIYILVFFLYLITKHVITDAIENIDAPPGSASSKLKIVYDSCVNIGKSFLLKVSY